MKKLILLLPLFLFLQSCESALDLKNQEYTIFLNLEDLKNCSSTEIWIEEYNDINDRIDIKKWENPNFLYDKKSFKAHKRASKIVIRVKYSIEAWHSTITEIFYYACVVRLEGKNTEVDIEGESLTSDYHPLYH